VRSRSACRFELTFGLLAAILTVTAIGLSRPCAAEDPSEEALEKAEHDPPLKPAGRLRTAPPTRVEVGTLQSVQVNGYAGLNIAGDAANEPSLAVDPVHPNRMAIGWRQFDSVFSNFRQAGYAYSVDAGRSWSFPGTIDPGVFRSDPVLGYDAEGTFYYSSLTPGFEGGLAVDFYRSTNGGMSWSGPIDAWGGDKQWFAVDRSNDIGHGNIYQTWAMAGACCGLATFTRSVNGGSIFENPIALPSNPQWGSMDVGPDGNVYIAGIPRGDGSRMAIVRSTTAEDAQYMPFFDLAQNVSIGGTMRAIQGDTTPNPDGLLGQAWIAADPSPQRAGWVYLVCSVDPPGPDPLDVMFARSTDAGVTWSPPVRLNNDAGTAWQWMATMAVAPNGRIDVVWNDTRNTSDMTWSELFYSVSMDGGTTWAGNVAVSPAWNSHIGWPNQSKIGDYYHIVSDRVGANVAYAATFNGEQDIWFLRIGDYDCNGNGVGDKFDVAAHTSTDWNANQIPDECEGLEVSAAPPPGVGAQLHQNVPNPFNPETRIGFEVQAAGPVRLRILDVGGRIVRRLDTHAVAGTNMVRWDGTDDAGRPVGSGVYVYRLESADFSASRRMVLVR